ncbi:MAG: hypothetical protein PVI01_04335 [Gemmatimonadales bacterium]|jgi:hypothetical protein
MNDGAPTHPTPEELLAYPLGELSEQRARAVFNHCNGCEECGRELAVIMQLRAQVVADASLREPAGAPLDDQPAVGPGRRGSWRWAAMAAGLVIVVAAALLMTGVLDLGEDAALPSPYADVATRDTLPENWYEFRFGGALPTGSGQRELREGLQALIEGDYEEAITVLQRRVVERPTDREATAYLGIAGYLSGDYSERTIELLRTGTADPRAGRWASWYLGNLALMNGDLAAAREEFDRLVLADDRVAREARAMLSRLPE